MADQVPRELNGEELNRMRLSIMEHFNCSEEDAATRMQSIWDNAFRNILQEAPPPPPVPPQPPAGEIQPPEDEIAFPEIDDDVMVGDTVPLTPSLFAMKKIRAKEYIDLWYFTTEGCKEANHTVPTTANTYGFLDSETGIAFQPIDAARPSKKAITDEHLCWEQIMTARHTFITAAQQAGWAPETLKAFAEFYINLESLKAEGRSPRPLILYHAVVRRQWHAITNPGAKRFNISRINEKLLNSLENQIRDSDHEALQKQARIGVGARDENENEMWAGRDRLDPSPPKTATRNESFERTAQTLKHGPSPPVRYASVGNDTISANVVHPPSGMAKMKHDAQERPMATSSTRPEEPSASTGIRSLDAPRDPLDTSMNAQDAAKRRMALKTAVSHRRLLPRTPLIAERWHDALVSSRLLQKYPKIPLRFVRRL
ncbi:hypothetical protein BJ322DRAFT_1216552 [Thelephora terrestris]|uniref:Uncharacterized protein n=1 Tax=Thelephora terrestris TaxID=56493 RepID=A0A9P6HN14_9AGAM|nr:hypothetical protein BJ322DRAFT_1216552 [Thelephora terrestris]